MRQLTGARAASDRKNIGGGEASTIVKGKEREKPDGPSVGAPVSSRRLECRVTRLTGEVGGFMVAALKRVNTTKSYGTNDRVRLQWILLCKVQDFCVQIHKNCPETF